MNYFKRKARVPSWPVPSPPASVEVKITGEVQVLRLRPGDRVVVTLDSNNVTRQEIDKIVSEFALKFPDNEVVVLANGIHISKQVAA